MTRPAAPTLLRLLTRPLAAFVLTGLLGLLSIGSARASAPTILNYTHSAATGDVLFLQGDNFGTSPRAQFSYNSASWVNLTTLTSGSNALTARLPFLPNQTNQAVRNLVTVRVYNGSAWSKSVYVNQARAFSYDTPEIASGSAFRVFGRDLFYGSQTPLVTPTVRLVDTVKGMADYGQSQPAIVDTVHSTAYVLQVTAPGGVLAGGVYAVYVSNGYNGNNSVGGEAIAQETLNGRTGGSDVWSLGVPWGADFSATYGNVYNVETDPRLTQHAVGDGVANDQPAIQAALWAAYYAGGGVVYLPAGTYKLVFDPTQTVGLEILSNVVLAGAGMNQTTVQYGYQFPGSTTFAQNFGVILGDTANPYSDMGVADMTIQNVDTTGQWSDNVFMNEWVPDSHGRVLTQTFFQRIRVQASQGAALWVSGGVSTKMAVENCDFELLGGYTDTWLGAGANSVFRGNTVRWSGGGAVSFGYTPDILVENNHFIRNCDYNTYPQVANTRCFDTAFNKNLVIQNNLFDVEGGVVNTKENDGETISSEGGANTAVDTDTGSVTSATATTLTDTGKNWTVPNDWRHLTTCFNNIAAVAIVGGKGAGEWQPIVPSTSPNTLTVPNPWTVIPDGTSKYVITDWACEDWLISGNTLNNGRVGIQIFFCSSHDTAVVGNTLTNDSGIVFVPFEDENAANPPKMFTPNWDDQIIGNTVTDTTGGYYPDPNPNNSYWDGSGPAQIGAQSGGFDAATNLGTSVLGLEVRGNTVNGSGAKFADYGNVSEGYMNEYSIGSDNGTTFTDTGVPALLGTIFQGNEANDCNTSPTVNCPWNSTWTANGAFRLTSGAYQTVLQDNVVGVAGILLEDDLLYRFNTASVSTYGSTAVGGGNNWLDVDIGGPSPAGSATLSHGVFTVAGGGLGIGGGPDQFNFCYETLSGNGTVIARVTGETGTGQYAKAGVMIRHTLDPMSQYFDTVLYPNYPSPGGDWVYTQCRYTDGGGDGGNGRKGGLPYWIKLVLSGTTFTSYSAPDRNGVPGAWTAFGGTNVGSVASGLDVGIAVTAANNGALNTATLDHVSVTTP